MKLFCRCDELEFVENLHGDKIYAYLTQKKIYRSLWKCKKCGRTVLNEYLHNPKLKKFTFEEEDIGNISDGYHTFNDLYHQRAILFATICNQNKNVSWKAKKHHDGTMFGDNWFIIGIDTIHGQYTYHYEMKYWDKFEVKELELAPEWDGHTDRDVERLLSLGGD